MSNVIKMLNMWEFRACYILMYKSIVISSVQLYIIFICRSKISFFALSQHACNDP